MRKITSTGFEKVAQSFSERRFEGRLSLKIFVDRTEDENADRERASAIMIEASEAIRNAGVQADASYAGLDEIN